MELRDLREKIGIDHLCRPVGEYYLAWIDDEDSNTIFSGLTHSMRLHACINAHLLAYFVSIECNSQGLKLPLSLPLPFTLYMSQFGSTQTDRIIEYLPSYAQHAVLYSSSALPHSRRNEVQIMLAIQLTRNQMDFVVLKEVLASPPRKDKEE